MNANDNSQTPDDTDSLDPQTARQTGDDVSPWYYRPPSGLNDWAAQMNRFSQGLDAAVGSPAVTPPTSENDNTQEQPATQSGQSQSLPNHIISNADLVPDFTVKEPLELQQSKGSEVKTVPSSSGTTVALVQAQGATTRNTLNSTPQSPQEVVDDNTNLLGSRPKEDLPYWIAHLWDHDNTNDYAKDLQFPNLHSQLRSESVDPEANILALSDFYTEQKMAEALYGQNQPLELRMTPAQGSAPDFMTNQPLRLQRNVPGYGGKNNGFGINDLTPHDDTPPFATPPLALGATEDGRNPQDYMAHPKGILPLRITPPPKPVNLDYYSTLETDGSMNPIGNIGEPNISPGVKGYSYGGSVASDWDGSIKAYGVRGTPTAFTGSDILDNASKNTHYNPMKRPEKSLSFGVIAMDSKGKPIINSSGYYQSLTSVKDTQEAGNMNNVDGEHVPYVALSDQQMRASGAKYGDYVWIQNTSTNQGAWAIVGDSRGSIVPGSKEAKKKADVELSPGAQDRIGIKRNISNPDKGGPAGSPFVEATVFPNTGGTRFYTPPK